MEAGKLFEKACKLGIGGTVKMGAVKWKKLELDFVFPTAPGRRMIIDRIFGREYKRIIIFENHFGYKNIMMQRPHHLLRNMGDDETLVLYNSYYDVDYEGRGRITQIGRSVYVLDMYYYREYLLKVAKNITNRYLMVYSTDTVPQRWIDGYLSCGFKVIYEYVDDINPDLIAPNKINEILKRHSILLKNRRVLTVATADKLYQNVLECEGKANVIQISNGAECAKFDPRSTTADKQYIDWLDSEKIHVGYYGALASWIDYDLLKRLTQEQDIQLILIGIEHDRSLGESNLLNLDNVRYFGKKDYESLAGYVHYFDVCIIPFVVNEVTRATSPVKLFEYMAMEKSVITTKLPECMKYDLVNVASDEEEFVSMVRKCWEQRDDVERKERLRQCAWENDWSAKAGELKTYLSQWEKNEG